MPAGDVSAETHKHETEHEASGSSPKRAHLETFPHGDVVPQTPVETGHEVLDDIPFERMMSPEKSPKRDGDSVRQIEHLDIEPHVSLESDDLDILIEHELDLSEDPYDVDLNMAASLKELSFPYSVQEPDVPADELQRLDAIADQVEIQRLTGLEVLQHDNLPEDCKSLSTRFVRTWRQKKNEAGEAIWLRRSRLVAREYAWLQPDREALFSPATSNVASRILPICFLSLREHSDAIMASLDVKDAFLTVQQEVPTRVVLKDAAGNSVTHSLGRVLPGQRDGSLLWYKDLAKFVKECPLEMEECEAYPSILRSKKGDCFPMIHVDDLLIVGS